MQSEIKIKQPSKIDMLARELREAQAAVTHAGGEAARLREGLEKAEHLHSKLISAAAKARLALIDAAVGPSSSDAE